MTLKQTVRLNRISNGAVYVEISGDGYNLSIKTVSGNPAELIEIAEAAELEAAKLTRRAIRLRDAAFQLAIRSRSV